MHHFRKQLDAALPPTTRPSTSSARSATASAKPTPLPPSAGSSAQQGDIPAAEALFSQAQNIRQAIGEIYDQGADHGNFAIALLNAGDSKLALDYARKAKAYFEQVGEPHLIEWINNLIAACQDNN